MQRYRFSTLRNFLLLVIIFFILRVRMTGIVQHIVTLYGVMIKIDWNWNWYWKLTLTRCNTALAGSPDMCEMLAAHGLRAKELSLSKPQRTPLQLCSTEAARCAMERGMNRYRTDRRSLHRDFLTSEHALLDRAVHVTSYSRRKEIERMGEDTVARKRKEEASIQRYLSTALWCGWWVRMWERLCVCKL